MLAVISRIVAEFWWGPERDRSWFQGTAPSCSKATFPSKTMVRSLKSSIPGEPCVSSWPGRYESAWDALVKASRGGHLSAAVVFLPEGSKHFWHSRHHPKIWGVARLVASNGKCVDVFPIGKEAFFVPMLDLLMGIRRKCHACGDPHYAIEKCGPKSAIMLIATTLVSKSG